MMKKLKLYISFVLFLVMVAQNISAQEGKSNISGPYKNTKVYTSDLIIDGEKLDKRIAKYYPESDLVAMKARKIRQLNYLYLKTFVVKDLDKLDDKTKAYIQNTFDAGQYEVMRKQKEMSIVHVNQDGFVFTIELLAREIIIAEKEKIQ